MSHIFGGETNIYHYNSDLSEVSVKVPVDFVNHPTQATAGYYTVILDSQDLKDFFAEYLKGRAIEALQRRSGEEFLRWLTLMGD